MKKTLLLTALAVIVFAGPALAQTKQPVDQIGTRLGPPNFAPLVDGDVCSDPNIDIPDGAGPDVGASDTLSSTIGGTISGNLLVGIEITHTWVGDLIVTLTHDDTGTSATIIDRPGQAGTGFGCSGDDIDATLDDSAATSVEDECAMAVPTISGTFQPFPDALSTFDGESFGGDWTLFVSDNAGADPGTLNRWCLSAAGAGDDGDDGDTGGVPATGPWGVMVLIVLFLGVSLFYLRRRSHA